MNKIVLKNFAVRARRKLIEDVTHKAYELGISKEKVLASATLDGGSIITEHENGQVIGKRETEHRAKLIDEIKAKGFEQVMEEVAYTWFNRFIALRFMELNDYLPTGVRVLSSLQEGKKEPDIIQQALTIDLGLDKNVIYELQDSGNATKLYKYLLIKQCNQLGKIMPSVFEPIADYTELLLPDNLLGEGAIIRDLVDSIEEYNWKIELSGDEIELEVDKAEHGIEIIGWLYQYYISEKKDEVFAGLKKNIKITKENIPAATQLFTPKWIVKYMIENSLGRLWLESHPNPNRQANWKYYLQDAEQEPEVQKQLDELKNPSLKPEEIKVLDPAMGSGHILVYAFDVLHDIYLSAGYAEKDVPSLILENNLYGLEIDDRAGQLASFALYMKGRSRNKKLFSNMPALNLCSIQESNGIPKEAVEYLVDPQESDIEKYIHREEAEYLVDVFNDAKEYGSILEVKEIDYDALEKRVEQIRNEPPADIMEMQYKDVILEKYTPLVKQGRIMSIKYDVVCTNPPYMGQSNMSKFISDFIKKRHEIFKNDLFSVFMQASFYFTKNRGHISLITPYVWMFLSSYEKLREYIINNKTIKTLVQLEYNAFEPACVPVCVFTMRNQATIENGHYIKLSDFKGIDNQPKKTLEAIKNVKVAYRYSGKTLDYKKIPGSPIAYWASEKIKNLFLDCDSLNEKALRITKGIFTGNNERFLRFWYEVRYPDIDGFKWNKYSKGGNYRKWYGNSMHIVKWDNNALELRNFPGSGIGSAKYYNKPHIVWSGLTIYKISFRYDCDDVFFDDVSPAVLLTREQIYLYLTLLNSVVINHVLEIIAPTLHYQAGDIKIIPVRSIPSKYESVINYIGHSIVGISKLDWDSFETSWDFQTHPMLTHKNSESTINQAFQNWSAFTETQFNQLKQNEEELNRIFIEIYDLQDELTPEVDDRDITISKADRERDIKSFLSYIVGCNFGRYSIDRPGLIYAGGNFSDNFRINNGWELNTENGWMESSIAIDGENIIPIVDDDYFENDIVKRVVDFVTASFGDEPLEENLSYIAETLGSKTAETPRQTIRRYFMKDFYKDHVRTYKKRPIYWLFDSGKENGFKALIYMHRYDPLTLARVRTDYLHKLQKNYEAVINQLDTVISSQASDREKAAAKKRKEKIRKQLEECRIYDQAIAHVANQRIEIDLDAGVIVNYAKFQEVEIPQGEGRKPLQADLLAKI